MPSCPTPTSDCESVHSEFHTDYDAAVGGGLTNFEHGIYTSYTYEVRYENCSEYSTTTYDMLIDEPEGPCGEEGLDATYTSTESTPCPQFGENPLGALLEYV
jgi:hypothetical protein